MPLGALQLIEPLLEAPGFTVGALAIGCTAYALGLRQEFLLALVTVLGGIGGMVAEHVLLTPFRPTNARRSASTRARERTGAAPAVPSSTDPGRPGWDTTPRGDGTRSRGKMS